MPKASRETASASIDGSGFTGHYEDFEGGYTVGFETFTEAVDMTPSLAGLPDDRCQSPHWGYVVSGKLTYKTPDRDEVIQEGEAFYVPAGHTLVTDAGTEVVFFSPTREWRETIDKIGKHREGAT
jgi:glyoxylate utilization-related uncharacterized protein